MKKCLSIVAVFLLLSAPLFAQMDPMLKFTKAYYRSNPFITTFGRFVEHVMQDPDLKDVKKRYRTDTTLFAFNATYTNYNPFHFKPSRVDVALIEQNIQLYQNRPNGDTIMLYVLIAYADSTPGGLEQLKKEYARIQRKADRYFFDRKEEAVSEDNISGMASNYFVNYAQMAPVTVEWVTGLTSRPILRVTMRLRSRGNESVLPMSLYDTSQLPLDDTE